MNTLAVNGRKAAIIMFDEGLTIKQVQKGINTIQQPTKGYYNISDIYKYIESQNND